MASLKIDYHNHTTLCNHAIGTLDEYIEKAIEQGIQEMGFADHNPMPNEFDKLHRMKEHQLPQYVATVLKAKEQYANRISIKLGLESDYLPGVESYLAKQFASHPFDYVLGSIHYLGDWNFDNPVFVHTWKDYDVDYIYQWYFDSVFKLVESGLFDILAHPDLIKKFGHRPVQLDIENLYNKICRGLKKQNMALEINTSGLRKEVQEIYPEKKLLEIAFANQIPITIGSDAHSPDQVGKDYDQAVQLALSVGYTQMMRFNQRKMEAVELG
jgi:histidinol-phosphatase (PHP family)